ncbi:hypothetical protein IFM89_007432 [Coptis chinensis]|uniref:ABC transmembrane type-1 domain-containing protein n=1 Tax=Coptis chinensis TaxID=261450 RepID=A0A835IAM9_9MAGN|nr:hypothetical protein IFM89_007432 [Coptis chinensis]
MTARLVYGRRYFSGGICSIDTWNKRDASGRLILCFSTIGSLLRSQAALAAFTANVSDLTFVEPMTKQIPDVDIIPHPVVVVQPSKTTIGQSSAPTVAYFSSRGPSSLGPDILNPDISAPRINILAAWPPKTPPTLLPIDRRSVNWNFQSGTSMSCPQVPIFLMHTSVFMSGLAFSIYFSWRLALVALPLMILLIIPGLIYGKYLIYLSKKFYKEYSKANTIVKQALSSIKTVYSFTAERRIVERYSVTLDRNVKAGIKAGGCKRASCWEHWSFICNMGFSCLVWKSFGYV